MSSPLKLRSVTRAVATIAFGLVLLNPVEAGAHVGLDSMEPAPGSVSEDVLDQLVMNFSSDITRDQLDIKLFYRDGRPVPFTGDRIERQGNTARAQLPALEYGTYVVTWSALGTDGHLAAGQEHFSFGFEEAGALADFQGASAGNVPETAVRWSVYAVMAILIGMVWLGRNGLGTESIARKARILGAAALVFTVLRLLLIAGRVGGERGVANGALQILTSWPAGLGWFLMAAGISVLAARQTGILAATALVAVAWGDGLAGHLGSDLRAGVLVPLIGVHLLAAGLWVGAPAAWLIAGEPGTLRRFSRRFTSWALGAFGAVAVSGLLLGWMRAGAFVERGVEELAVYPYGAALLLKTAAVAVVVLPLGGYQAFLTLKARLGEISAKLKGEDALHMSPTEGRWERPLMRLEVAAMATLLAAGAFLGTLPSTPPRSTQLAGSADMLAVPESFEACMTGGEVDRLICANNWFKSVAETQGIPVALQDLTVRWQEGDSWIQLNCHAIAHTIGRYAYGQIQDTVTAFGQGSDPCDYGYLHGVIEGASAQYSDEELQAAFTTLCEGTGDVFNHTYRQCIHGLGHAAGRRTNNDLGRAVEFCRVFWKDGLDASRLAVTGVRDQKDADSLVFNLCITGVSMEWNLTPEARESSRLPLGSEGTLIHECMQVEEKFRPGCLEYGTSSIGGGAEGFEENLNVLRWCDQNLEDPLPCYLSVGRGVIWSPYITDEQAMEVCTSGLGGEYEEACITWALGSVATIALDASAIDDFCPVVPLEHQDLCEIVRTGMEIQLKQTMRGFIVE